MSHYRDLADGWATNRGGGPVGKTYAEWLAYVNARPSTTARAFSASAPMGVGFHRTVCNSSDDISTHNLFGSPWVSTFRQQSGVTHTSRLIQHALPSEVTFNEQRAAAKVVLFEIVSIAAAPALSRDRNAFLSTADGDKTIIMPLIVWHDEATQQVLANNPYAGTGPTPYPFP